MTEFLNGLQSVLSVFAQSDVFDPPPPTWYIVLTGQAAHFLIGAALAYFRARPLVLATVAGVWIAKELLGDIPNGGGAALVYVDSVADLGFAALGFWFVRKKRETPAMKPDDPNSPPAPIESGDARAPKRTVPKLKSDDDQNLQVSVSDEDQLRDLLGTKTRAMAEGISLGALNALGVSGAQYREMMAAMGAEMEPRDAVEAMLFSQQVATHTTIMTLAGKVMDAPSPQLREGYERSMTRLSRTFLAQMDGLKRYRVTAQRTVRVKRVDVHDGGQAIVGTVEAGGRGDEEKQR